MAEEKLNIKKSKWIRKIVYSITGIVFVLFILAYVIFKSSTVQTWLVKKLTAYLEEKLHTKVSVKGVDIGWPTHLILEGVYVQDLKQDTLAYIGLLKINPTRLEFDSNYFYTNNIILEDATVKLHRGKKEKDFNYEFIVNAFSSDSKDTSASNIKIVIADLTLKNVHFIYKDEPNIEPMPGMNYWDLDINIINCNLKNTRFERDSIFSSITHLSAKEKCGFNLTDFSGKSIVSSTNLFINDLHIETDSSSVNGQLEFKYKTYSDYLDFIEQVKMHGKFQESIVYTEDIAYFAPQLKGIKNKIKLTGKIDGFVNDLKCRKVTLDMFEKTTIAGDFNFKGLPNIDETFLFLHFTKIASNKKDLLSIPLYPFTDNTFIELPNNINIPDSFNFSGSFTGFLDDFIAYGVTNSSFGSIKTDLILNKTTDPKRKYSYQGNISTANFDLGALLKTSSIGTINLNAEIDGKGLKQDNIQAFLKGHINSIELNNYQYKNAELSGLFEKNLFSGNLNMNDENIRLQFDGDIDFKSETTHLKFGSRIKGANLYALNIINNKNSGELSANALIDVRFTKLEDIIGSIKMDSIIYNYSNGVVNSNYFNVTSVKTNNNRIIDIKSDLLDANMNGTFLFSDIGNAFISILYNYLPNIASSKKMTSVKHNYFFNIKFKRSTDLLKVFYPSLSIANNSEITGSVDLEKLNLDVNFKCEKFSTDKYDFNKINAYLTNTNNKLDLSAKLHSIKISDSLSLNNFNIYSISNSTNKISTEINWNFNSENVLNELKSDVSFNVGNQIGFQFKPSSIYINNVKWEIIQSMPSTIDTSSISIGNIAISSDSQSINLEGIISKLSDKKATVNVSNFNLATINPFIKSIGLQTNGTISGKTILSNLYATPVITSNLSIQKLSINNEYLGNGELKSNWETSKDWIEMEGFLSKNIVEKNIAFTGKYYPKKEFDNLDFKANFIDVKLKLIEQYITEYCKYLKGQFSGAITINGTPQNPIIAGSLNIIGGQTKINYLNTTYRFSGNVELESNAFNINNFKVTDEKNDSALVNGKLYHEKFKNFQLDFDMKAHNFMCLNTTEANNNLYYGKANVTGYINFFGYVDKILIDASIKTEKGTQFNIPLTSTSEVGEFDYITFIKKGADSKTKKKNYVANLNGIQLHFDINMTPDAEVQLIFDSKVGDIIRGRGDGLITLDINTLGTFKMHGNYAITSGDYLFTLKNIINKKFDIQSGSSIKWSGDPYEADIDITAIYKQKASIHPFFPNDSLDYEYNRRRYPVDCKLFLRNRLLSPDITFDIDLPTLNTAKSQQIKSYINTEQEMNRQVFSLLVLKSFVTPPQLLGIGGTGDYVSAGGVTGANSFELLSNQVSNMFSQLVKDVDVGVNYRPGDNISSDELEVALSTQLFNDRITIDGNLGVGGNAARQNNSNFAGDVNIEYKVTRDGKLRVKAFNKTNDNTLLSNTTAPYTQGAGLFYREEFNTLAELVKRYKDKAKIRKGK
ncbi:MAG: translocation/assembly module TamB [Bacteroidetes bacterium]|nr:translocation/assembly module TamB [Bacteroidota bacterium]